MSSNEAEIQTSTTTSTSTSTSTSETQVEQTSSLPSLFDISYKIKYVPRNRASLGTILIVFYRKVNNIMKEHKIQDDGKNVIFNLIRDFYDNIDKLYVDSLNVSNSFAYTELIKILFENKEGTVWADRDSQNKYIFFESKKYIDECSTYELINLLYGKIRMYAEVFRNFGYKKKFNDEITCLTEIFENFVAALPPRRENKSQSKVESIDDETGAITETMCDIIEYYEDFADLVFTNLRNIEVEDRSKTKKNLDSNSDNKSKNQKNERDRGNNSKASNYNRNQRNNNRKN